MLKGISHTPSLLTPSHPRRSEQSSVHVQASPTADNPGEAVEPKQCHQLSQRLGGAQGGVIVLSRKNSCIQHSPSSHQGLKLSFLGQFLSPSCNIPGIFLALRGPEKFCEVLAVARAGQSIW